MEMTDFIEKLAEQFDDVDAGLLTTETKFHELDDYTSLVALNSLVLTERQARCVTMTNMMAFLRL